MKKIKPNKALADKLFRELIRTKYKSLCVICHSTYSPQTAHLISRRYYNTRWDLTNAVILCSKHHMKYTHDPLGWEEWCETWLGKDEWQALKAKARQYGKTNYKELIIRLEAGGN